jgi:hypothetical protein
MTDTKTLCVLSTFLLAIAVFLLSYITFSNATEYTRKD